MVRIERTPVLPASLAVEKKKANGSYREPDVIRQLCHDFNGKCYLCEMGELQSIEVEHLHPHGGDIDRKFAWDNLFYSCAHCNSVKNQSKYYDMILDCCETDPEAVLDQQFIGGHVKVKPLAETQEAQMTAVLLMECFELTNTGIREYECQTRVKALSVTMTTLYKALEKYRTAPTERNLRTLRGMLSRTYKFAGFTRTYVRNHLEKYLSLAEYVQI